MNLTRAPEPGRPPAFYRCTSCLLCGSKNLELALPLTPSALANDYSPSPGRVQERYSISLYLCHDCGNVQIEDVVNPDLLFRSYHYVTSSSLGLVEHFRQYAANVVHSIAPPKGSLVIDIGSNDGSLLRAFKDQGMRVMGVDPAAEIARQATASGLETVPEFFTSRLAHELKRRNVQAAVITANNVFAHSDQLPDMADGIAELLAPDGVFCFEVSYLADIIQKMLFDTVYLEHLCYHSVRPLASFFRRHGLDLIDVERIPTKGGSIRGTVQRAAGPRHPSPVIADMIDLELALGLDKVETYRAYADHIAVVKNQLHDLLAKIRATGKSIAGYGASPTVTTLLFHFELGDKVDFLVDDNPVKHNTFSPGHRIPVYDSKKLYERKADYALVLAWNYSRQIMEKHRAFTANGGHFIVPLPFLQVA
jgi:SAM-dependent methyltransferase